MRGTIERLYAAFAALDGDAMEACYAIDAHFQDEVFPDLNGAREIGGMWKMLIANVKKHPSSLAHWKVVVSLVTDASAHWDCNYLFSRRPVLNSVDASFQFNADGLIVNHVDKFDFWNWSKQAMGVTGWVLGWTPLLRSKVQSQAASSLEKHLQGSCGSPIEEVPVKVRCGT